MNIKNSIILSVSIVVFILFFSLIFYIYAFDDWGSPSPWEPSFDFDEKISPGWFNISIIKIDFKEVVNWSDLKIGFSENRGIFRESGLIPELNGPVNMASISNNHWGHSGDDDIIDVNETFYIKHSLFGRCIDVYIRTKDYNYGYYGQSLSFLDNPAPYEIQGGIRNEVLTLENYRGESLSLDSQITLYSQDYNRNNLFMNFTVADYIDDINMDGNWSEGEMLNITLDHGFLNPKWYFCYFIVYDSSRDITLIEEAHVYT